MNEDYSSSSLKRGRWTKEEQNLFNFAYQWHGKDWKKLSEIIPTRSIVQIRSHAQKYCKKFKNKENQELQAPKVYIMESALESLNQYISNTCANSYKKYMELQQNLMYAQISPPDYEVKMDDTSIKGELNHN
jgi:SHAQKYF class myb-like DNA-binding protein